MTNRSLVIGGTLQGIRVALDLAETGQPVSLIEEGPTLGPDVAGEDGAREAGLTRQDVVPMLLRAITHPRIDVMTGARLLELKGESGRFRARISRTPTYVSEEFCRGCGICIEACPVVLDGSRTGGSGERKAIDFPSSLSVPFVPNIIKERRAPCVETCPAHINIQGYVALVSKGKFREAYDLIRETIPFPSVCGRVCFHPCETACNRDEVDEPIAINNIKRFVSEYVHREGLLETPERIDATGPKVAVIGSGPAGLTAAHDLIRMGYRPTVFEALDEPGGMLRVGIVSYRLPREILAREIRDLEALGVEIETGRRIGEDLTIEELYGRGFESIFLSTGAHGARRLGIEGETLRGVVDAVTFLREVNLKGRYRLGKDVIVIGGGNVALDCARTALRVGAKTVRMVCLESREEMPSHEWEIEEALEEGVLLMPSLGPKRILGARGRVTGLETLKVKHVFDEAGRFNPAFHEGTESIVEGTSIIAAIGQVAELDFLEGVEGVERDERGRLRVDPRTLMTTRPGLFAGGDMVTGPASVIDAIAHGKRAAVAIDSFLRGEAEEIPEWSSMRGEPSEPFTVPEGVPRSARVTPERLDPAKRTRDFAEVERTISAEMAVAEAARCLNCGSCSECMECVRVCDILHAVEHTQFGEEIEIEAASVVVASDLSGKGREGEDGHALGALLGIEFDRRGAPLLPRGAEGSLAASRDGIYVPSPARDGWFEKMLRASAASGELAETWGRPLPDGVVREKASAPEGRAARVGVFVCRCGGGISDTVDVERVAGDLGELDAIVHAGLVDYACSPEGLAAMRAQVERLGLDALLLAACSCCSLEQVCGNCSHQRVRQKEGLLAELGLERRQLELVNIREHAAWAHAADPEAATRTALRMSMAGMQGLLSRDIAGGERRREIGKRVAVVGDGTIARTCAGTLQALGFDTVLLKTGGGAADRSDGFPARNVIDRIDGVDVQGGVGSFLLRLTGHTGIEEVRSDFVVLAGDTGPPVERKREPKRFSVLEPFAGRRRGLFEAHGTNKKDDAWKTMAGRALAMRVLVERGSGVLPVTSWAPEVDAFWCRGCGTCVEVCPFDACRLVESGRSVQVSEVDPLVCEGCEICVLHCPTGALRAGYFDDRNLDRLLGAVLEEENGGGDGPRVVVYACHWCHYGGPSFGERGEHDCPPGVRVLRLTCTGRIGPNFVLKAFQHGADGVMVMGCPDGECHYEEGNRSYREHEQVVLDLMETMGIAPARYRTLWSSPGEGARFVREVEAFVKGLGGGERP